MKGRILLCALSMALCASTLVEGLSVAQAFTYREAVCEYLVDRGKIDGVPRVLIEGYVVRIDNGEPILDAEVSTDLDWETATTDESGRFCLLTRTPAEFCCTPYTITVSAYGFSTFSETYTWGDHPINQEFYLHPRYADE